MISKLEFLGQPREVFARLRHRTAASLLESASLIPGLSGWSYIACDPVFTLETRADQTVLLENTNVLESWENPFDALESVFNRFSLELQTRPEGMSFAGGWLGFLGYDLMRYLENISPKTNALRRGDPCGRPFQDTLPDLRLHLMDFVLAFDHASNTWYSSTTNLVGIENREYIRAEVLELTRKTRGNHKTRMLSRACSTLSRLHSGGRYFSSQLNPPTRDRIFW
jgi:para-aminobenzoate synthetase component I